MGIIGFNEAGDIFGRIPFGEGVAARAAWENLPDFLLLGDQPC